MQRIRSRKGAPGIIEVAKRAGVSPATVSRFFNTPDVVKPPTRTRIQQAAEDLGYIRDRMAGSLHNRFSGTIGLVVPTIDNAIFAELIQAFSAQLRRHDRTMLIAAHGYDLALEVLLIRSLLERRIDGIAMIGLEHNIASLEMLATRHVPVLAAWNYRDDSPISCVGANNFDAGFRVSRYLVEHGQRPGIRPSARRAGGIEPLPSGSSCKPQCGDGL
jgi:LacI family transcriptional regulator